MVKEWAANLVMELSPVKLRGFSIWEIPTNLTDLLGLKDMVRKSIIGARGAVGPESHGIGVETWKSGKRIVAQTEVNPWTTLNQGKVPSYGYEENADSSRKGTNIKIDGFQAKQSEFKSLDALTEYVRWYTVLVSFGKYFGDSKSMSLNLKPADTYFSITIPFGFKFPDEQLDLSNGTENACKFFWTASSAPAAAIAGIACWRGAGSINATGARSRHRRLLIVVKQRMAKP